MELKDITQAQQYSSEEKFLLTNNIIGLLCGVKKAVAIELGRTSPQESMRSVRDQMEGALNNIKSLLHEGDSVSVNIPAIMGDMGGNNRFEAAPVPIVISKKSSESVSQFPMDRGYCC